MLGPKKWAGCYVVVGHILGQKKAPRRLT
jgi:hypothetical protein